MENEEKKPEEIQLVEKEIDFEGKIEINMGEGHTPTVTFKTTEGTHVFSSGLFSVLKEYWISKYGKEVK